MATETDRPYVFTGLQEGALVLADISGYSKFVAQTEVDHSWSILHELLDTVVRSVEGRMDVSQVEGDAILFISGLSTSEVISAVNETFIAFHRRLRDMRTVTTCPCNACANIGILKLKFIVHHGKFSRQRLGGVEQLHGTDVIVAHRLLKNSVQSKEYVLATDAVLDRLPVDVRQRFHPHTEEFDLGTISGGYEEIAYLWAEAQARERKRVMLHEALIASDITVQMSAATVYGRLLQPEVMERYLFSDRVVAIPGARGDELGSEFHCHHGGSIVSMRVVSIEPGLELTLAVDQPDGCYITTRLTDCGDGQTRIQRSFLWDEPADPELAQPIRQMMSAVVQSSEDVLRLVFNQSTSA